MGGPNLPGEIVPESPVCHDASWVRAGGKYGWSLQRRDTIRGHVEVLSVRKRHRAHAGRARCLLGHIGLRRRTQGPGARVNDIDRSGLSKRLQIEARRIAGQHEKLGELWGGFLTAFGRQQGDSVRRTFETLREALLSHFELEERVHLPALHGARRGIEAELARIVDDHRRFTNALEEVSEGLASEHFPAVEAVVESLLASLNEHEAREERLFTED